MINLVQFLFLFLYFHYLVQFLFEAYNNGQQIVERSANILSSEEDASDAKDVYFSFSCETEPL